VDEQKAARQKESAARQALEDIERNRHKMRVEGREEKRERETL
jgi:hypothetical protein